MLFQDELSAPGGERPRRRTPRTVIAGYWALGVAVVAMLAMVVLPSGYVIQQPGPVFDTLGSAKNADGEEVPLIHIGGDTPTFETGGTLDLTTVQVRGSREATPSWAEILLAWFDPSLAVVPVDVVFPAGQTVEQREQQNTALMVNSQHQAIAAALHQLGYTFGTQLTVAQITADGPSDGVLEVGDVIISVDGAPVADTAALRDLLTAGAGTPITVVVERAGVEQELQVTPDYGPIGDVDGWRVGISLQAEYVFPIDVSIQLDNVGGPSAGMMFALGIIDELTPGKLNGGRNVAGTGTIAPDGTVGPIGGIRQKLYGAQREGAEFFLAPAANCDEVVGHVPAGMQVIRTETLQQSVDALDVIASGTGVDELPRCTAG